MSMGFIIGGMLGRVVGPIAQDWFENETELGKQISEKKIEKQRRLSEEEHIQYYKTIKRIRLLKQRTDSEFQRRKERY